MAENTPIVEQRFQAIQQAAIVGALVNLLLAVVKTLVGVVAQSQSLVADGIHSLSDLLSDGLVYFVSRHARHGPDSDHPYGHGRFETMATMALGGLLILVALGICWDAFLRMLAPETLLEPSAIALYAAGFSIIANEALFIYTLRVGKRVKSDLLLANAWHHRSDAVSSVAVLVGIGGTMAGLPYMDAVAAIGVAIMIAKIGWDLGWGAAQELVDVGLPEERVQAIKTTIATVGGVRDFHMLRTRSLGGRAAVDVHVLVEPRLSVSEGHMIGLMVEQELKQGIEEIEDVTIHIDSENDESAILSNALPLRTEALLMLDQCWRGIDKTVANNRITLHYLNGQIEVELYFDKSESPDPVEIEHLKSAVAGEKIFGEVRVFVG
ncbi:Cobalt-zinc-cadmium resistance protein [hydrothermal vent metagenome]|uniref:Cobalt-zinc-cadmium resistance protein n=1 Tax=hydrothermal vent metagenome TaxID=652676 RepID=A0A3B1C0K8_9ZZZZ